MRMSVTNRLLAYITPVAAPILTFMVAALVARSKGNDTLDTAKVFTSLSIFVLLATPLGSFIMSLSSFLGAVGCFKRIEAFLNTEARVDTRNKPLQISNKDGSKSSSEDDGNSSSATEMIEQKPKTSDVDRKENLLSDDNVVVVKNTSITWDKEKDPILRDLNFAIQREKLTAIVGPVGCGKSTLLKAILGEVLIIEGSIHVASTESAYCEQTPWLINGTIQQSILGVMGFDKHWYATVIHACALEEDLRVLPQGDLTLIGSKGISLSGGQAQRVVSYHRFSTFSFRP